MPPPRARHPDVALGHLADAARLDVLDDAAVVVAGVDLRAHLRGDAGLPGGLADEPRLLHVVRERLLAVDVLLQLQGGQRGERVRVLGGADNDGVELRGVVEETAEVDLLARPGILRGRLVEGVLVDVAERGDVLAGEPLQVGPALPAAADDGEAELVAGLGAENGGAGGPCAGGNGAGRLDESAPGGSIDAGHGV